MKTSKNSLIIVSAVFFILTFVKIYSQSLPSELGIKFENEQTAVLVGQDGLIMRTENGGLNWTTQNSNVTTVLYGTNSIMDYELLNPYRIQLAVGENGVVLKSTDNGETWILKDIGVTQTLRSVDVMTNSLYIAAGDSGIIIRSVDKGESWSSVSSGVTENLNDIMFVQYPHQVVSASRGIVIGNNGTILISDDYGLTWSPVSSNTAENLNSLHFAYENLIFAAGNNGVMLKSNDLGESWTAVTTGVQGNIYDVKLISETVCLATGENGLIIRSEDGGETWSVITSGVSTDLFTVNFGSSNAGIAAGENGTELYTNDGGLSWENRESFNSISCREKNNVKLSQNFPNPFNPTTKISYELPFNSYVSVKVYDMLGKEVRTLANGYQNAGSYNITFDASNLSSGLYFYTINAGSFVKTMKMILTK
jgi:photosystem II stability/assembly factor-like uncharacterized protein